ncbi:MAG: hypothetical protein HY565_03695 [Candidatus Kerfeldbacteria bacterium]|nr:hypothetical protein [Candidatus Kerfeldbacteria bacterium]
MQKIHAWLRAILFFTLTFIEGCIAFTGGMLWSLTLGWFTAYHPLGSMPYWWSWRVQHWCFQPLGFSWLTEMCADLRGDNRLKIVLFKHPPTILSWAVAYFTGRYVSQRMAFVLKGSHIFNPMGWGLWALGLGIFTTRFHEWAVWRWWPQLQRDLHRLSNWWYRYQVSRLMARAKRTPGGIAIVILPDQRYTAERRAQYLAKFGQHVPGFATWQGVLLPRILGTLELFQASAGLDVPVVWVNLTLRAKGAEGWFNFAPYINGRANVVVQEITAELRAAAPHRDISQFTQAGLRDWLNTFYGEQNLLDVAWEGWVDD